MFSESEISAIESIGNCSSLADLDQRSVSEVFDEQMSEKSLNIDMLNLEILKLSEQKKYLKEEIGSMEEMVQILQKEKNILQLSSSQCQAELENEKKYSSELKLNLDENSIVLTTQNDRINELMDQIAQLR